MIERYFRLRPESTFCPICGSWHTWKGGELHLYLDEKTSYKYTCKGITIRMWFEEDPLKMIVSTDYFCTAIPHYVKGNGYFRNNGDVLESEISFLIEDYQEFPKKKCIECERKTYSCNDASDISDVSGKEYHLHEAKIFFKVKFKEKNAVTTKTLDIDAYNKSIRKEIMAIYDKRIRKTVKGNLLFDGYSYYSYDLEKGLILEDRIFLFEKARLFTFPIENIERGQIVLYNNTPYFVDKVNLDHVIGINPWSKMDIYPHDGIMGIKYYLKLITSDELNSFLIGIWK